MSDANLLDIAWQVDAALGSDGQPWVVWNQHGVQVTRRLAGDGWLLPERLNPGQEDIGLQPQIAVDEIGEGWVVWNALPGDSDPCDWGNVCVTNTVCGSWRPFGIIDNDEVGGCASDCVPDIQTGHGFPPQVTWMHIPSGASTADAEICWAGSAESGWSVQQFISGPDNPRVTDEYPACGVGPWGPVIAWMRGFGSPPNMDIFCSRMIMDALGFNAERDGGGVRVRWRLAGGGDRKAWECLLMRASAPADTVKIGEARPWGDGWDSVFDSSARTDLAYTYWIVAREIDTGTTYLLGSPSTVPPVSVSVRDRAQGDLGGAWPTVKLWPQPASHQVLIDVSSPAAGYDIELFDIQGRRLLQAVRRIIVPDGEPQGRACVAFGAPASLPSGVYRLRVTCSARHLQKETKLIVQH